MIAVRSINDNHPFHARILGTERPLYIEYNGILTLFFGFRRINPLFQLRIEQLFIQRERNRFI